MVCVVRQRFLPQDDHSSRGVLPAVVRHCLGSRNLKNEEDIVHIGPQRRKRRRKRERDLPFSVTAGAAKASRYN